MIKQDKIRIVCIALVVGFGANATCAANGNLNSSALEFFEEPIAFDRFGFIATYYNQLADAPVVYDFTSREIDLHARASFQKESRLNRGVRSRCTGSSGG